MNQSSPQESRKVITRASVLILSMMFFFSIILITVSQASSNHLSNDDVAPNFTLTDLSGKSHALSDFKGKIVVLEWTNPGCPFVVGQYKTGNMQALQKKYTQKGVVWLAINSTNPNHGNHKSKEELAEIYNEWKAAYSAQLVDEDGAVGKLYSAKTTPHLFIIDKEGKLAYQGAIDDDRSTKGGANAKINYVENALDELLAGKTVSKSLTNPYGCGVKY